MSAHEVGELAPPKEDSLFTGNPERPRTRSAVLVFLVVVLILLWRPLFGRGDLLATDILSPLPPWDATTRVDFQPHNWILGDTLDEFNDMYLFYSQARQGHLELWNPYIAGGTPASVAPVYYPTNWLYLFLPFHYAVGLNAAIRLFLAMLFMFFFLRELGVRHWAGVVGGVAYGLSAFNVVWLEWPHTNVSILIPALFWTTERVVRKPTAGRAAGVAAVWAAMLLGGFPAVAGHAAYAVAAYVLVRSWMLRRDEGRRFGRSLLRAGVWMAAGVAVGTLISGVYLLPFAGRYTSAALSYRESLARGHLTGNFLITALVPNAYGAHYLPNNWWGGISNNYVETELYAGILPLLLAASSLLLGRTGGDGGPRRALGAFFVVTALVALMIVFGKPFAFLKLIGHLPVFSNSQPGRVRDVYNFAIAAAAALGLHAWGDYARRRLPPRRFKAGLLAAGAVVLAGAAAALLASRGPWRSYLDGVRKYHVLSYTELRFAIFGTFLFVAFALLAITLATRRHRLLELGALAIVAADLLYFAYPYWPVVPHGDFFPVTPAHRAAIAAAGDGRFLGLDWAFYPNTSNVYGMFDARGHTLYDPSYEDALKTVDPTAFLATAPTQPYLTYPATDLSSPWLDRMAVQIVAYDVRKPPIGLTSSGDSPTNRSQVLRGAVDIPVPALRAPLSGVQLDVRSADGGMLSPVLVALIDPQGREVGRATRRVQTLGEGWASWVLPTTRIDETGYRIRITEASPITVASSGARPSIRWLRPTSPSLYPIYGDDLVIYRRTTALPRARFTARWRVGDDTVQQLANESSAGPVVLDRALPGVTAPSASSGSARIVVDRPDTVTIESRSTGPGLVVLADTYGAGWRATVDGRAVPIARADRMFRAVAVGAGEHRVTFTYRPKSFERGAAATAVGLLALAGLAAAPAVRRRLGVPGASV